VVQPNGGCEYESLGGAWTRGVDLGRVLSAAGCNSFAVWALPKPGGSWSCLDAPACGTGTALFAVPSLFNHACVPNCGVTIVGDVAVVAAGADIPAGAELTLTYATAVDAHLFPPPRPPPAEPIDELVPSAPPPPPAPLPPAPALLEWGFECKCAVCTRHAAEPEAFASAAKMLAEDAPLLKADPVRPAPAQRRREVFLCDCFSPTTNQT
jgi:hypothetical protein